MDNERNQGRFESVFSKKVRAGKRRTYFFDVRRTKGDDYYLTLTESTKRFNGEGYERHKIFLYKEDFNRFISGLEEAVNHIKTELMPDYDYDEYTRRNEEWEARRAEENSMNGDNSYNNNHNNNHQEEVPAVEEEEDVDITEEVETEDDISW
ncbi:MAG: DUF3276 family protein [Bacteroidota bacterium]